MKKIALTTLIVLSLAACGGGSVKSGPSVCSVDVAKAGEAVTCSVSGFKDGCTLFLGATPVEALFNDETGTVTFDVPPAPAGFADIVYGCGADTPETVQKNFQILPSLTPESPESEDTKDDGDVILPEDPEAPLPEEPEDDAPTTPGKDLVIGGELSAGTGGGAVVSLAGTDDVHETNLRMVRVRWKIAGDVQDAYIHAAFNRKAFDGAKGDPCGEIEGRFLAVNDDGNDFNEGSADAEAASGYLTGKKCHNNGDCVGFAPGPMPKSPICRIDLKSFLDQGRTEGEFYTFSHQKEFRMVLVAKTADGEVVRDERTWKAPKPGFNDLSVSMLSAQGRLRFAAEYRFGAKSPTLSHCADKQVFLDVRSADGRGTYEATCRVSSGISHPGISLHGIGYGNVLKRKYRVEVSGGGLILKDAGNNQCDQFGFLHKDCSGTLNLAAQSEPASYEIRNLKSGDIVDQGGFDLTGTVILKVRKNDTWEKVGEGDLFGEESLVTFKNVRRDHDHSAWRVEMGDSKIVSPELNLPYEMTFDPEIAQGGLPSGFGGNCDEALLQTRVTWKGQHVRKIGTNQSGVTIAQPDLDEYGEQSGDIVITAKDPGPHEFSFWVIAADGVKHEEVFTVPLSCP